VLRVLSNGGKIMYQCNLSESQSLLNRAFFLTMLSHYTTMSSRSQSLLNRAFFLTCSMCSCNITTKSQSLLNRAFFLTEVLGEVSLKPAVSIPFKQGILSNDMNSETIVNLYSLNPF